MEHNDIINIYDASNCILNNINKTLTYDEKIHRLKTYLVSILNLQSIKPIDVSLHDDTDTDILLNFIKENKLTIIDVQKILNWHLNK